MSGSQSKKNSFDTKESEREKEKITHKSNFVCVYRITKKQNVVRLIQTPVEDYQREIYRINNDEKGRSKVFGL